MSLPNLQNSTENEKEALPPPPLYCIDQLGSTGSTQLDADYDILLQAGTGVANWALEQPSAPTPELANSNGSSSIQSEVEDEEDHDIANDLEMTASGDDAESTVCYGMLYQVDVKLIGIMSVLSEKLAPSQGPSTDTADVQQFTLGMRTNHILLSMDDDTGFGYLRENMTKELEPFLRQKDLEFEAVARKWRLRERIGKADRSADAIVHVNINIYGPRSRAETVGEELSAKKLWLQRPDDYKKRYAYENPHVIRFPGFDAALQLEQVRSEVAAARPRAQEERLGELVSGLDEGLQRANDTRREKGDNRLETPLLEHQQRALAFMLQRESGDIDEKYLLWERKLFDGQEMFTHRITKTRSQVRPEEKGGGILADEMGMGKSLSLLALLLQTLDDGHSWAEKKRSEEHGSDRFQRYTHSTLVVVPSALLINNWLNEINIHLGNALTVIKYHGPGRERDLDKLQDSDLVITTYNTLAAEFAEHKTRAVLHTISWYRLVLDEAHIIRRPSTTFHRTCADIEAKSRWCLTGTPIQNKLDDIGALFMFLKAEPFHSLAQFRRFISVPFEQADPIARDRLILLYDAWCLRRNKEILRLPGSDERHVKLALTPAERDQYRRTENIVRRYMHQQVGEHSTGHAMQAPTSKFGLFQAHLQLRILCNHGTFQRLFSWKKRSAADDDVLAAEARLAELGDLAERTCAGCGQPRPVLGYARVSSQGFVERCSHVLCGDCLDDSQAAGEGTGVGAARRHCPLCRRFGRAEKEPDMFVGDVVMGDAEGEESREKMLDEKHAKIYFNDAGFSTKMDRLIQDVKENLETTKSIVFSCWTKTLDLVARHLRLESIKFLRIDGESLLSQRQKTLNEFAKSDEYRVLLMTTGTGAFGLNLTAANRVFLVEPQWNPSVENQAVARAIRLRQEERVLVTRYVIQDTVEASMQEQQVKKRRVAALGVAGAEDAGGSAMDVDEGHGSATVSGEVDGSEEEDISDGLDSEGDMMLDVEMEGE